MLRAGGAPKGVPGPGAAREGQEGREGEVGRWQERRKRGLRSVVHGVRGKKARSLVPGGWLGSSLPQIQATCLVSRHPPGSREGGEALAGKAPAWRTL